MTDKKLMTAEEFFIEKGFSYPNGDLEPTMAVSLMESYAKYLFDNVVPKKSEVSPKYRTWYNDGWDQCIDQIKENLNGIL